MRVHRLLTLGPSEEELWVKISVRPLGRDRRSRDERSDRRGFAHAHHSSPTTASVALDLHDRQGYLHFLRYTPNVVTPGDGPVPT